MYLCAYIQIYVELFLYLHIYVYIYTTIHIHKNQHTFPSVQTDPSFTKFPELCCRHLNQSGMRQKRIRDLRVYLENDKRPRSF